MVENKWVLDLDFILYIILSIYDIGCLHDFRYVVIELLIL